MAGMRTVALLVVLAATPAAAETFAGFSGVDAPYLVDAARVCTPLPVQDGVAKGNPRCETQGAGAVARLSIKPPRVQRGTKAEFAASASGATMTVTNAAGDTVVTWTAPDPIDRIVEVYASKYDDRVAVAYQVRRLGREITAVVAFALPKQTATPAPATPIAVPPAGGVPVKADPRVAKAVNAAHRAGHAHALARWKAVLALDPQQAEALYRIAAIEAGKHRRTAALASLAALAKSPRPDAIEWRVEARFDRAFAGLRADPAFRAAAALDRPPATTYERLMGFGGQWEQTGTSCDRAEVHFRAHRDRTFDLRVKTSCEGQVFETPFHGTWKVAGKQVILVLPTHGQKVTEHDEAPCTFKKAGAEDALHCSLGHDLEFEVLPTRR